jgi:hypothetical protein
VTWLFGWAFPMIRIGCSRWSTMPSPNQGSSSAAAARLAMKQNPRLSDDRITYLRAGFL